MAIGAKRPCNQPGCPELTTTRFCPAHTKRDRQRYDTSRGTASQRGYNTDWRKARAYYLQRNPLCAMCSQVGKVTPATVVHHLVPHKGDNAKFWDRTNWQSLCKPCHDRHAQAQDKHGDVMGCSADGTPIDGGHHWNT